MSKLSRKVNRWDGPNKRRARARKLILAELEKQAGRLPEHPTALTFAGSKAHFERGLVGRGVVRARDIVTIQTSQKIGGHDGASVLYRLIRMRDSYLRGMAIWPHSFHSFSLGYNPQKMVIPSFSSMDKPPRWYKSPKFRKEMLSFLDRKNKSKFNIIDADICGIFSKRNAEDIVRLMKKGLFDDRGLLFINHLKGRDGRFGKLFEFLREYFRSCEHFDADSLEDEDGIKLDLSQEDYLSFWFVRYVLVPVYYVCEAFNAGYMLEVVRLVEYRDKNPSTRAGVNMLQWYFRFSRLKSCKLEAEGKKLQACKTRFSELRRLRENLDIIAREAYPYSNHVD